MALLFKLIRATFRSNIFCSSQYHSSNDHPLLHYALSFVRKLRRKCNLDCIVVKLSWLYFTKFKTMNEVIPTYDRIFMSIVGPSGCDKTELIFHMLQGNSFYSRFEKIYYFYKEFQPLFIEMQGSIAGIEFIKYSGLEMTKNLSNCLLIFDDSCEEIFNEKEFVEIATSGRHRKLHVISVKHNLFHQNKWSKTIDLNTTHIIFFKLIRDIQQIEYLGKQLNCLQLIKDAYKLATAEPFEHLMIDLDPNPARVDAFHRNLLDLILRFFTFLHKKNSSHQLRMKKKHLLMVKQWANSRNKNSNIQS